jgi:hypothetical protein
MRKIWKYLDKIWISLEKNRVSISSCFLFLPTAHGQVWGKGGGVYVNAVILLANIMRGEESKFPHAYADLFHWSPHIYYPPRSLDLFYKSRLFLNSPLWEKIWKYLDKSGSPVSSMWGVRGRSLNPPPAYAEAFYWSAPKYSPLSRDLFYKSRLIRFSPLYSPPLSRDLFLNPD